jgi:hypothetical protein
MRACKLSFTARGRLVVEGSGAVAAEAIFPIQTLNATEEGMSTVRVLSIARHRLSRLMVRIWFRFQVAVITYLLAVVPVLAATHDSPLPSDTEIRNMLITRIDVQHRGTGAIVVIVTPTGRRKIAYGSVAEGEKRLVSGDRI